MASVLIGKLTVVAKQIPWSLDDIEYVRANYPIIGSKCALELNRSINSIKHKARELGVKAPSSRWTAAQEQLLQKLYPDFGASYTANKIGKSIPAIQQKAQKLKIRSNYNQIKTTDDYIDDLEAKGITYRPFEDYKGAHTPIKHICSNGHVWNTSSPSNILRFEAGCTECKNLNTPTKLYYVKIIKNGKIYYKLGITNKNNWKRRFATDLQTCDFKLLYLEEFPTRELARKKEKEILSKNREYLTKDKPLVAGNTEVFDKDILNFDHSSTGPHLQHRHLVVTASVLKPPKDPVYITQWLHNLIEKLGMKAMMPVAAAYSEVIGNRGLTAVAVIETSNIALHVWDEESPAQFQLDVYSCSSVEPEVIWNAITEFDPVTKEYYFLDRADGFVTLVEKSS